MSARVTDERLAQMLHDLSPNVERRCRALTKIALCEDLRDERTAHRATEAKLRDALDDIERRRKLANDDGETIRSWANRATAAESALAATKAKLEAAEDALRKFYATFPEKHYLPASDRDWTDANACPHCYEPDMSVDTHRPDCPYVATRAALTTQEAPDENSI